jgi:hypothetical protein
MGPAFITSFNQRGVMTVGAVKVTARQKNDTAELTRIIYERILLYSAKIHNIILKLP